MTTTPTKSERQRLGELVIRLEAVANSLLQAEVWDDIKIEGAFERLYVFKEVIGYNDQSLANYLSDSWGLCNPSQEEAFTPEAWMNGHLGSAWTHDYTANMNDEVWKHLLPDGWVMVDWSEFESEFGEYEFKPTKGEQLLRLIAETSFDALIQDDGEFEVDVLGDDRRVSGEAMVMTGYLTNQDNLTADEVTILGAYKAFSKALQQALVEVDC